MADNLDFIRDLFKQANVSLNRDDVWAVQGAPVVRHRALERLAAVIGIEFSSPVILRNEADEAVILATGRKGDKSEWSIGEARVVLMHDTGRKNDKGRTIYAPPDGAVGNYQITPRQSAYPYAMAEKRAKDRVILKLAGLHGVYSEEESDDFRQRERDEEREPDPALIASPTPPLWPQRPLRGKVTVESGPQEPPSLTERAVAMEKRLVDAKTSAELITLWRDMDLDLKPAFRARVAALGEALKAEEEV